MTNSVHLQFPFLNSNQAGAEASANLDLAMLDAHVHLSVLDRDLATPPGSPTEGARYLVAAAPTGAWTGHAGHIAVYLNGWKFSIPREGWFMYIDDENRYMRHDGTVWLTVPIVNPQQKSIAILNPTSSDNVFMFFTSVAMTITGSAAVLRGSGSQSVTYQVNHASTRNSGSPNQLYSSSQTVTSITNGTIVTNFSGGDPTIPQASWVWVTISAVGATTNEFDLALFFTED